MMTPRLLQRTRFALCVFILCTIGSLAKTVDAEIVYDINNYASNSPWTLSGTITTDGTLGSLTVSNITTWNILAEHATLADQVFGPGLHAGSGQTDTISGIGGLSASASALTLSGMFEGSGNNGIAFQYEADGVSLLWVSADAAEEFLGTNGLNPVSAMFFGSNGWGPSDITSDSSGGTFELATSSSAVPEPSSIFLVLVGLFASFRRRIKHATA